MARCLLISLVAWPGPDPEPCGLLASDVFEAAVFGCAQACRGFWAFVYSQCKEASISEPDGSGAHAFYKNHVPSSPLQLHPPETPNSWQRCTHLGCSLWLPMRSVRLKPWLGHTFPKLADCIVLLSARHIFRCSRQLATVPCISASVDRSPVTVSWLFWGATHSVLRPLRWQSGAYFSISALCEEK